ncbi:MAG TPA: glycosyltransferase family 2 protein [Candidatus Paceibacterota bacterium]
MTTRRVTVVTVVFGDRWDLLRQVADSLLPDPLATTFVIVDNGCTDRELMDAYAANHPDRVVVLRQEENIGYSGAIRKGLEYARTTDCDRVFVLDDDSVPEPGAIGRLYENLAFFPEPEKIVLAGNRIDVADNAKVFNRLPSKTLMPKGTLFEVFSFRKFVSLVRLLLRIPKPAGDPYLPMVPLEALVTGGSFIPIGAIRTTELPDPELFLYGEDLEFSWRMRRNGYSCYVCAQPVIRDIDLTFSKEGDHIFDLFESKFRDYKVYFRIRNAVIISRRNTIQAPPVLLANVLIWTAGLIAIGFFAKGLSKTFFKRARIILRAVRDGYGSERTPPPFIEIPGRKRA